MPKREKIIPDTRALALTVLGNDSVRGSLRKTVKKLAEFAKTGN
jgi:hypothetical protein